MSSHRQSPLDTEEARFAQLYGQLRDEEPSPQLDARIRAQAHAAVRPKRPVWLWGVGVAASAVLAVGLFSRMGLPEMQQSASTASRPADDEGTVVRSVEIVPPPPPPEPPRNDAPASSADSSMVSTQEAPTTAGVLEESTAQQAADTLGDERASTNEAIRAQPERERPAAAAVIASRKTSKDEAFADGLGETVAEAKTDADAVASQVMPGKRAEALSDRLNSAEQRDRVAQEPVPSREADASSRPAPPQPVVFDEPSPMAVEAPPPAPPAPPPPAPPLEMERPKPAAMAPPKVVSGRVAESPSESARSNAVSEPEPEPDAAGGANSELERQQLVKLKEEDASAIDVTSKGISPIDVSSVEGVETTADSVPAGDDRISALIAKQPARFRSALKRNSRLYPESWQHRIKELIEAGNREEAVANLRVFRMSYPDHRLFGALATLASEEGLDKDSTPQP